MARQFVLKKLLTNEHELQPLAFTESNVFIFLMGAIPLCYTNIMVFITV